DSNYDKIVELWLNDHDFRERLRNEPLKAVADAGIKLTAEEQQVLSTFDFAKFTNEEIEARILGRDSGSGGSTGDRAIGENELAAAAVGVHPVSAFSHGTVPQISSLPGPRFTKI